MQTANPIPIINYEAIRQELGAERAVKSPHSHIQGSHIEYKDGRSLFLRVSDGRLITSGDWPKERGGRESYPSSHEKEGRTTSITRAATSTPVQIARDIQRRLLDDYTFVFEKVKARVEGSNRYEDETQATLKRLLALAEVPSDEERFRGQYQPKQTSFSLYHSTHPRLKEHSMCDVKVNGDGVQIDLHLKIAEAEGILGLLKAGPLHMQGYENSDTPTEAGWHLWGGPNNHGDNVTPVRTYWIGPNLHGGPARQPELPGAHSQSRRVRRLERKAQAVNDEEFLRRVAELLQSRMDTVPECPCGALKKQV